MRWPDQMPIRRFFLMATWFVALFAGAVGLKAVFVLTRHLPERLPMVAVIPADATDEQRRILEEELARAGAAVVFVSKDTGLAVLRQRLASQATDDSAALAGIETNPLPDVYVIRSSDPEKYARLKEIVESVWPSADLRFEPSALHRLSPIIKVLRFGASAALAFLAFLFCMSLSDHLGASARKAEPFLSAFGDLLRSAVFSLLLSIAAVSGSLALLGLAASRRPDLPLRPYAQLLEKFFRAVPIDGIFAAQFLSALTALLLLSVWAHVRSNPGEVT